MKHEKRRLTPAQVGLIESEEWRNCRLFYDHENSINRHRWKSFVSVYTGNYVHDADIKTLKLAEQFVAGREQVARDEGREKDMTKIQHIRYAIYSFIYEKQLRGDR